jgi:hypothetical protein
MLVGYENGFNFFVLYYIIQLSPLSVITVNVIIRLLLLEIGWHKVITLSGVHSICTFIQREQTELKLKQINLSFKRIIFCI